MSTAFWIWLPTSSLKVDPERFNDFHIWDSTINWIEKLFLKVRWKVHRFLFSRGKVASTTSRFESKVFTKVRFFVEAPADKTTCWCSRHGHQATERLFGYASKGTTYSEASIQCKLSCLNLRTWSETSSLHPDFQSNALNCGVYWMFEIFSVVG